MQCLGCKRDLSSITSKTIIVICPECCTRHEVIKDKETEDPLYLKKIVRIENDNAQYI